MMWPKTVVALVLCVGLFCVVLGLDSSSQAQSHFQSPSNFTESNDSNDSISNSKTITITSPHHPSYTLSLTPTDPNWCDSSIGIKKYMGYLSVRRTRHLFFYFFESSRDNRHRYSSKSNSKASRSHDDGEEDEDLILWTNGGPGSSSAIGLFMEHGPCLVNESGDGNGTRWNKYSWNERAHMIYIDQPVGESESPTPSSSSLFPLPLPLLIPTSPPIHQSTNLIIRY